MSSSALPSIDKPTSAPKSRQKKETEPIEETPAEVQEGYLPRRVDVKLTRAQASVLRDKFRMLQDSGAKTADGRFVASRTQAVQWIMENEVKL